MRRIEIQMRLPEKFHTDVFCFTFGMEYFGFGHFGSKTLKILGLEINFFTKPICIKNIFLDFIMLNMCIYQTFLLFRRKLLLFNLDCVTDISFLYVFPFDLTGCPNKITIFSSHELNCRKTKFLE